MRGEKSIGSRCSNEISEVSPHAWRKDMMPCGYTTLMRGISTCVEKRVRTHDVHIRCERYLHMRGEKQSRNN